MSFQVLPPEINSAQLFSGAGPGPMLAAAAAWDELAAELGFTAESFSSVTSGLAGASWQGPASAAMTAAAASYAGWLSSVGTQAAQTSSQARAAATVFEAAQAAAVHPALVAANRDRLVTLVLSNLLGQNAPAISAAEAEYEQMWAQDVAAMVGYHGGASAAVSALTPFTGPLASLGGLGGRLAGPPAAVATAAASGLASLVPPTFTFGLPRIPVNLNPEISIPSIYVPGFALPAITVPGINVGSFTTPYVPIGTITLGNFSVPGTSVTLASSSLTIPAFNFGATAIGDGSVDLTIGGFSTPQLSTGPIILPGLSIPVNIWIPPNGAIISQMPSNFPGGFPSYLNLILGHNGMSPYGYYIDIKLDGVPDVIATTGAISIDLHLPPVIYDNVAIEIDGPTIIPSIYIGDYTVGSGFVGNTGFVLPPITVTGITLPALSIPAWNTPSVTITDPGLTVTLSATDVSGVSVGPIFVPPIGIGAFQLPQAVIGGIGVGAFSTPPVTIAGPHVSGSLATSITVADPLYGLVSGGQGPVAPPAVTTVLPRITAPQVSIPGFSLPALTVPPIQVASFYTGPISVPSINLAELSIGSITLPSIDATVTPGLISVGLFTTPGITTVGNISLPSIQIPQITTPEITLINPQNPTDSIGTVINVYDYVSLGGSDITLEPNPFALSITTAVPALQIPPLTLVNAGDPTNAISTSFGLTLNSFTLPQITVPGFSIGPDPINVDVSGVTINPIDLTNFALPTIAIPPINVGAPLSPLPSGFNLPSIDVGGIQLGGFSTPGPVTIPPIEISQALHSPLSGFYHTLLGIPQDVLGAVNATTDALLGRPLIG